MSDVLASSFALTLEFALPGETEDGVAMNVQDMTVRGWRRGDYVAVTAISRVAGRLIPVEDIPPGTIALAPLLLSSTGGSSGTKVDIILAPASPAECIVLAASGSDTPNQGERLGNPLARLFGSDDTTKARQLPLLDAQAIGERAITKGSLLCRSGLQFRVVEIIPDGVVTAVASTVVTVLDPLDKQTSYNDVGGLSNEVARIREMVELPLRQPELFVRLGVDAPRGLLLYGPPGSGKTLIARAIAQQTDAYFISVNGPEIIQKHYGESEELLRKVFEEAQKHPATILFIDEIDALAPNRETVLGELEKRVVGQLLALMDGVASRGRVVVLAATNLPNNVDPALRRPGRFDREIAINPPTKAGRLEIIKIHTRFMPLAADVDLERVAAVTHGFLGADLAALCREAAMACARDSGNGMTSSLFVQMVHFQKALADFRLSTMRELSSDIPETRWEDIGGLEEPKRLLRQALEWPLLYGARFDLVGAHAPKGILLTGASGTGKTLLAQAVGTTTEVNFIVARGPELLSKWVGESERGIREVFRRARQSAPTIIFFDEIDAVTPARGKATGDGQIGDRMVGQFLLELDSIDSGTEVVVLAATNRPDLVDPALLRPGRFDLVIDLPEPDRATRLDIMEVHCRQSPLGTDVALPALADMTQGMNGAELAALCQEAKMLAIEASVKAEPGPDFAPFEIGARHFAAALRSIRSIPQRDESEKRERRSI